MPSTRHPAVLSLLLATVTGCSLMTDPICTTEARPGLMVDVVDSITGAPAGSGAMIIATSGSYADTARYTEAYPSPYPLAHEAAGTFVVTVKQEGYRPWSRSGIRVDKGDCHVRTVAVTARLQR